MSKSKKISQSFLVGGVFGLSVFLFFWFLWEPVGKMRIVSQSSTVTRDELVGLQNLAIQKAKAEGKYKCCINPPCTMCFWEGNQWNNNTPGTCACDDLIAQGKDPCPQCARAMKDGKGECNHERTS